MDRVAQRDQRRRVEELSATSFQLNLNETKFMVVHVDDVMRNTSLPRIRDARLQLDVAHTARLYQAQCSGSQRHDHVVMKVNMVTSVRARRKPPLCDDDAIVVDLDKGGCIHG